MTEYAFIPHHPPRLPEAEMFKRADRFYRDINSRRSVRHFSSRDVPCRLVERAIQTASSAPSGAHRQPWTFVAIKEPTLKTKIRIAAENEENISYQSRMPQDWLEALAPLGTTWRKPFLETAPWLVVVFAQSYGLDPQGSKIKHYYVQESVGIACGFFIAALHRMGLSTLTHTPSPMRFLSRILERPSNERPYMLFPIGYAGRDAEVPDLRRKSLDEVSVWR